VGGDTAGAALAALESAQPKLRGWILDERGQLREHVSLFVNDEGARLERPVSEADEIYIVHAISGGSGDDREILAATRKGLFVLRGSAAGGFELADRHFAGEVAEIAIRDPRTGRYFAAVTHGQFGPRICWTDDLDGEWQQADGPVFPEGTDAAVARIWVIQPGEADGEIWAGVAPAALFRSGDNGESWEMNRGLWDQPSRPDWQGGLGGLCLHSICPYPGAPQRLAIAISAAGVWHTEDGGASWSRGVEGLVPRYLPEEVRANTLQHCVHHLERAPLDPDTFYLQFHGGVYRSDDGGRRWNDIGAGLPSDFGFPLVADPHDPDRAFVIPLVADVDRVTPDGRIAVYETADRGASWSALTEGLPPNAYATILRQAFCHDGHDPLGLCFGTEQGAVYFSGDRGQSWTTAAENLPPVVAVRTG
jgi:photosystem II stability/assembly factor-like uncharacterized protein